jgi:hypothetical protein
MNAIKFRHAGQMTGHMVSSDQAGTFEIVNTGKNNVFTDLLIRRRHSSWTPITSRSTTIRSAGRAAIISPMIRPIHTARTLRASRSLMPSIRQWPQSMRLKVRRRCSWISL